MGVVSVFPTPIYTIRAAGDKFDAIQYELNACYNKINMKHLPYTPDAHEVSTDKDGNFFRGCLLQAYNCTNFLKFLDHSVKQYVYTISKGTADSTYSITESWFTKTLKGQYAPHHNHGDADLSGVYYLDTNGEDGRLKIVSPHRYFCGNYIYGITNRLSQESTITLQNGVLGLWPSILDHSTEANETDHERISLSFNICFSKLEQQEVKHNYY